jgi:hypothetical protein
LSPFELVQLMTDIACVLRIDDEKIEDVMKKIIGREQPEDDRRNYQKCRDIMHGSFL